MNRSASSFVFLFLFSFALTGLAIWSPIANAGDEAAAKEVTYEPIDPWADARRPISNPTHFDLAIPTTNLHPFVLVNTMPNSVDTILGQVPVGGNYQVYAIQAEFALSERLSINASKDGYINFQPDSTLEKTNGWANVALGPKYAWLYQPENGLASNFQLLYEIPMGNQDVWQGTGDGVFIPSISTLKLTGPWQFANQFGFKLPIDGDTESSIFYTSGHVSYKLTDWLFPMVEASWFKVIEEGDGGSRFQPQLGGALPGVIGFEGGDLVNWGASNASRNSSFVSLAVGARVRCPDQPWDFGFAWEFPLTEEDAGLMKNRFIFDLVFRF